MNEATTAAEIIDGIIELEGQQGYAVDGDSGGRTAWGISERAHPEAWADGPPTKQVARSIYEREYLSPWLWVPDYRLKAMLVDWSVTSGVRTATRGLQSAVAAKVDGVIGPDTKRLTVAALNAGRPVFGDVLRARAEHYMDIALNERRLRVLTATGTPLQIRFLRGWLRRVLDFV